MRVPQSHCPTTSIERSIVLTTLALMPAMALLGFGETMIAAYLLGNMVVSMHILVTLATTVAVLVLFLLAVTGGPIRFLTGRGGAAPHVVELSRFRLRAFAERVWKSLRWLLIPPSVTPPATDKIVALRPFRLFQGMTQLADHWVPGTSPTIHYHPSPILH